MRQMSSEEMHSHLIDLAKELHRICTENGIPYYMVCGTMLGAVRHKGFIPWDDDMDFAIPLEYYQKFVDVANSKLQSKYRLLTYKNSEYPVNYLKIEDTETIISEFRMKKECCQKYGINIDIFILTKCSLSPKKLNILFKKKHFYHILLSRAFVEGKEPGFKGIIKKIIRLVYHSKKDRENLIEKIEKINKKIAKTGEEARISTSTAAYLPQYIIPNDVFGTPQLYQFENIQLYGVENYDSYLKSYYGDYMQIPPIEQREFHSDGYFYKE